MIHQGEQQKLYISITNQNKINCLLFFRSRHGRGNNLKLKVNFLPEIITLYKEVRNLKSLGFRVPLAIVNKAHQANQIYPFAISLIESVRTYERTLEKVSFFKFKLISNILNRIF